MGTKNASIKPQDNKKHDLRELKKHLDMMEEHTEKIRCEPQGISSAILKPAQKELNDRTAEFIALANENIKQTYDRLSQISVSRPEKHENSDKKPGDLPRKEARPWFTTEVIWKSDKDGK